MDVCFNGHNILRSKLFFFLINILRSKLVSELCNDAK